MSTASNFKRLVAREVRFTTKNKDQTVCFRLGNEGLEVCVNGNFDKHLQILRISFDKGIKLLDQDDWTAAIPPGYRELTEKIARLAHVAEVPIFTIHGHSNAEVTTVALLQLQRNELLLSWTSDHYEVTSFPSKHVLLWTSKIAKWLASKQFILAVQELSISDVQFESIKAFSEVAAAVVVTIPRGAMGYTLALCLAHLLTKGCPLMLVEKPFNLEFGIWKFQPSSICCSPPDAAQRALTLLEDLLQAYRNTRPFVHTMIGNGIMEADLREALETAVDFLQSAEVVPLPPALRNAVERSVETPRVLIPIGRGGHELARLAEEQLDDLWCRGEALHTQGDTALLLLDLSDPDALRFLRCAASSSGAVGQAPHVLALLPGMAAARSAWTSLAEPLAILLGAGEEQADLGLVIATCLGDAEGLDVRDAILLLEALATAPLTEVAFQLQPFPQTHLVLASFQDSSELLSLFGNEVGIGEVTTSFSLWPKTSAPRLLPAELLKPELPEVVARGGAEYQPSRSSRDSRNSRVWHLLLNEEREAALLKRAAGDFAGRAQGAFHFRQRPGPSAELWSLATKLLQGEVPGEEPEAAEGSLLQDAQGSDGYSEDYEDEDQADQTSCDASNDDAITSC